MAPHTHIGELLKSQALRIQGCMHEVSLGTPWTTLNSNTRPGKTKDCQPKNASQRKGRQSHRRHGSPALKVFHKASPSPSLASKHPSRSPTTSIPKGPQLRLRLRLRLVAVLPFEGALRADEVTRRLRPSEAPLVRTTRFRRPEEGRVPREGRTGRLTCIDP